MAPEKGLSTWRTRAVRGREQFEADSMRLAILIGIVLVHIAVLLLIWQGDRMTVEPPESSLSMTLILLEAPVPPRQSEPASPATARIRPTAPARGTAPKVSPGMTALQPEQTVDSPLKPAQTDWLLEAEQTAAKWARDQIDSDRKASALSRCYKPLTGRGQARSPDGPNRVKSGSRGIFIAQLTDHCFGVSWLAFLGLQCTLGKSAARGDLFLYMHGPVQYGDWMNVDPNPNAVDTSCDRQGSTPARR